MSEEIKDGGPMFPCGVEKFHGPQRTVERFTGLTKREWFAAMALQGLVMKFPSVPNDDIARHAFGYADAMISASQAPMSDGEGKSK